MGESGARRTAYNPGMILTAAAALWLLAAKPSPAPEVKWQPWSPEIFEKAKAEHKLVLLDLVAVWCHWCHVMEHDTYSNDAVRRLLADHYLAVRADQDAVPELSKRYENWGWPATIVFKEDGTELVKRRGFIPPRGMAGMLRAVVDDPTPGPSVFAEPELPTAAGTGLDAPTLKAAHDHLDGLYDEEHAGWGHMHRLLDASILEEAIAAGQHGDAVQLARAHRTLRQTLRLIDPVWSGVYQYSDALDWSSPHFEKLTSIQGDALRAYALGYAQWKEPELLAAAQGVRGYLKAFLQSPDGAFYVSQDADLSDAVNGHVYYAKPDAQRRALGIPNVDRHLYARDNGWIISGLCKLSDASGDAGPLAEARRAAAWVLANRATQDGGFLHDAGSTQPVLGDNLAMAEAFYALHQSTADRSFLDHARATLDFIDRHFADGSGAGYDSTPAGKGKGVFAHPVRTVDENAALARLTNGVFRASGQARYQAMSSRAMRFLATSGKAEPDRISPLALLAQSEVASEPLHLTLVGAKSDAGAQALYGTGRALPATYKLLEWWDRKEGPLPHETPAFPELDKPAVFVCTGTSCSLPLYTTARLIDRTKSAR